ncbi:MAG: hypothetical protein LBO09_07890 [Candidatus Peribacteria bacterium]|jgi:hypothetical protein|nr:hypothetical protein [Candidatus Peribacteria bacterium]
MIWAIVNNILSSINRVCYKKALSFSKLSDILFSRMGESRGVPISLILVAVVGFDANVLTWIVLLGVLSSIGICTYSSVLDQKLWKQEKMSNILPYSNLKSVFAIIAGFLIFRDASVWSFVIAIVTFFVIMAFSIDFKKLTLPKSAKLILSIQLLGTVDTLLTGRLLKSVADVEYYVMYELLIAVILLFPILKQGAFKQLKTSTASLYTYLFGGSIFGHASWLLYLFTVGEF